MRDRETQQLLSRIRQLERQLSDSQLPQDIGLVTANAGGSQWIRFTADTNIAASASSTGTVVDSSSSSVTVGTVVPIYNGTPNSIRVGAVGVAIRAGETWVAIVIATPAQFVAATATSHSHAWAGSEASPTTSMPAAINPLTIASPVYLTPWPSDHQVSLPIRNPFGFFWRSGATLLLMFSPRDGGCYEVVHVTAGTLRVKFRLTANVSTGDLVETTAAVAVLPMVDAGVLPTAAINVVDRYCLTHNAKIGDMGTADLNLGDGTWEVSECDHVATFLMGQLTSSGFTGTPTNMSVNQVYGLNGRSPTASGSATMNVRNRFNWASGPANGRVYFAWDQILGEYFAIQMTCP